MPGFLVGNGKSQDSIREICAVDVVKDKYPGNNDQHEFALRSTLNKFMNDKCFAETKGLFVLLDGYLLNKEELLSEYKVNIVEDLLTVMYHKEGEAFFSRFRGCFSGALFDMGEKKWIIFTNQIGDAPVFYSVNGNEFAAGSQIIDMLDWCRIQNMELSFNESCAYQIMTYGFVASDETYANEIKRLHGGDYIVWSGGDLSVKTYHRFNKDHQRFAGMSEAALIEEVDKAFRDAVRLEWNKDDEYGYSHLADLSGGLDSRMNNWVAHEEKDRKATVLTYSKEGYLDHIIAEQITAYWKDEFVFRALDDARFMYDIDVNTESLGGLSFYSAITGGNRLLNSLDLNRYGIEHTGMVGDIVLGSFYSKPNDGDRKWPTGMNSEKYKDKLAATTVDISGNYYDHEIYLMYTRGFHGACNTHLLRRNYTEVGSPFLNVDFMQLCFDIPVEERIGHNLYKKWVIAKYPEAAGFIWEKTGGPLTEGDFTKNCRRIKKAIKRRISKSKINADGMNPIDYWIANNEDLRNYLDDYEQKGYSFLPDTVSDSLIFDMHELYRTGNFVEKSMVLTVLASSRLYFGDMSNGQVA